MRLWLPVLVLTVVIAAAPAWSGAYTPQQIVPGVGIGPARLGMTDAQVRRVLVTFALDSHGCTVDVLSSHDRVTALGTRFGGCLQLALPADAVRIMAISGMLLPEVGGIGGTPAPLVRAFGNPGRFELDRGMAVLLWPNGLVARIATSDTYEIVTYLAVVLPGTAVPPYSLLTALPPPD